MTDEQTLLAIIGGLFTALSAWWIWWQRKTQITVEQHDTRLTRLEENVVTADEVRSIIHQGNEPIMALITSLRDKQAESNAHVHNILLAQAERTGYEKAIKEFKE